MSSDVIKADNLRVLVVDDNRDAAESMGMLVELWGYNVQVRFDAPSALAAACCFRPHVVLLDIGMPKMDGYQLAQQIRQYAVKDAVLIAVTGYADLAHRRQWESTFDQYLVKPAPVAEVERLLATVKKTIHLPQQDPRDTICSGDTLPVEKKKPCPPAPSRQAALV